MMNMRWFSTPSKVFLHRIAIASLLAGPAFWSSFSQGAVKIVSVENASVVEIPTVATGETIIYGGVAGGAVTGPDVNAPYDTCANSPGTDLRPCNNRQIFPSLRLRITYVSDSVDGQNVIMTDPTRTGGTGVGVRITPESDSAQTSTKGTNTTVIVRWGSICQNIPAVEATTCLPTNQAQDHRSETHIGLKVGVSKNLDDNLGSDDDSVSVTVKISYWMNQDGSGESIAQPCTDANAQGVCHFEVVPGDAKVILKNVVGLNNFPTISPLTIKKLRLLWTEGDSTRLVKTALNAKTPPTHYRDLDVTGSGTSLQVSPSRVTGLQNDQVYAFKIAAIDQAGNVGYFTADEAGGSQYCEFATNRQSCHVTAPSEVIGALTETMNCFIATAAFGSTMAPQVETFRNFRDRYLATNEIGRAVGKFYYKYSPKLAGAIADSEILRAGSRLLLWPVLAFVWLSLKIGFGWTLALLGFFVLTPFAVRRRLRRA